MGFLESMARILGKSLEIFMWAVLIIAAGALVGAALARLWRPRGAPEAPEPDDEPAMLCGLDVSPEALPADIVAAALGHWRDGRAEEALRVLYRGTLSRLVDKRQLPLRDSWTEGDCLRHLQKEWKGTPLVDYFARLTGAWLRTAYAQRPPRDDEMGKLTGDWPVHFGAAPS